jgi:hypothetical protein
MFFNAEIAKGHAEERRVFGVQSQFISMPTEIIGLTNHAGNILLNCNKAEVRVSWFVSIRDMN